MTSPDASVRPVTDPTRQDPDHSPPAALLSVEDLQIHFEGKRGIVHAVDGVSFEVYDGETLGLVGETGSGKSVTAKSVLRLVPRPPGLYAGGRVLFRPRVTCNRCQGVGCDDCGQVGRVPSPCPACGGVGLGCADCEGTGRETIDLLTIPEERLRRIRGDRIAMIFQDPGKALNPALSVRHQLAEVFAEHRAEELLREAGLGRAEVGAAAPLLRRAARMRSTWLERRLLRVPPLRPLWHRLEAALDERIAKALADTRIPNPRKVMRSYPHELSGGMKQRVMIAQGLACDPDLLIADEPTTALDVTIQARILDLISELQERHHTAVLYISHDLSLVRRISDRVAVLYASRLAEVGPTRRIFDQPQHPYTKGLLAAIPALGQQRGSLTAIEGTVPELIDVGPGCRFHGRCAHAAEVCARLDPPWIRAGDQHRVACLLHADPGDVGVDPDAMPKERTIR